MPRHSFFTISAIFALALPVPGPHAQPATPPPNSFDLQAIDTYVAHQVQAKEMVGVSLAIMRDGKIVLAKGYGKAALPDGPAVGSDTMFAIGSVTKQFTCACILLLAEDGKLAVGDKVAKYYPDLTQANEITLYDLMTHVSGYPDYYPLDFVDRRMAKAIALDKLIAEYAGGKLDFPPRTKWSYSNTGFIILGRVVEKVTGESFASFLERRILKPVGMTRTMFEPTRTEKGLAQGYTSFALGEPELAVLEADGWIHAAGGLYSTASDLCKWDLALTTGKLLKPESYELMTRPRKLADGRTRNYACGLAIGQNAGETFYRHGGAVSGYLAQNAFIPRTRSAVVLLTNCENAEASTLHGTLLGLLLKEDAGPGNDIPKVQGPSAKDAALDLLHQMQAGDIKRDQLGEEFNLYLSPKRVEAARDRLKALGEPTKVDVEETHERGGMEVAVIRFTFKSAVVKASLYRTPDGKVQQFLLLKA